MQTVSENKRLLRDLCKKRRRSMLSSERVQCDISVQTAALKLIDELEPEIVLCYVSSLDIEVRTIELIKELLTRDIRVAVPKSLPEGYELEFYLIDSLDSLSRGYYNILEPDTELCRRAELREGLCIVPGLAFDRFGRRMGFGKGYYDRFLGNGDFTAVGLCYECCIFDEIPHDEYDAVMDFVVTEKGITRQKGVYNGE